MIAATRAFRRTLVGTVILAVLITVPAAAATPGTLDTSFSGDGRATVGFGALDPATTVVMQPDGKVLVGGTGPGGTLAVSRLLANGAPDVTFSGDGRVTTAFPTAVSGVVLRVLPDGRIAAAGVVHDIDADYYQDAVALARYLPNGALDTSFGVGGTRLSAFSEWISAVRFQADGKLVYSGNYQITAGKFDGFISRLLPDGTADGGVGDGCYCLGGGQWAAFASQPDGKIVVDTQDPYLGLVRYLPNFSPDPSFGNQGLTTGMSGVTDMLIQPDGRILGAGTRQNATSDIYLERRLASGSPDASFGSSGKVTLDLGGSDSLTAIAHQPNGRIVGVGRSGNALVIVRFLANGRLDTSFAGTGIRRISFPSAASAAGNDVALQGDGKIVTAGAVSSGGFAVARVWGDAVPACNAKPPTIASGEPLVYGSNGADVIFGSVGDDRIYAGTGDDTICSHTGNDTVYGEHGADSIRAGLGTDRVEGGAGADLLYGEGGDDSLFGLNDNDRLDGGAGTDRADGGAGTDIGVANETQLNIP